MYIRKHGGKAFKEDWAGIWVARTGFAQFLWLLVRVSDISREPREQCSAKVN